MSLAALFPTSIFDHCKSVKQVIEAGIDCYMSEGTRGALGIQSHRIKTVSVSPRKAFDIGTWRIMPFSTQHDAAEPVGYLLQSGHDKVLFSTDTFYLKYRFKGLTHIMLECNYSNDILERNIKNGTVHPGRRKRLLTSHFEFDQVKEFFRKNDMSTVEEIHLLHISHKNGDPELFKLGVQELTGIPVYTMSN